MSPMHPKLRQALLRDAEHRRRGLTAQKLLDYERLLTELFYATHYATEKGKPRPRSEPPGDLLEKIRKFRDEWMPNFDDIHAQWVEAQKRALTRKAFSFRPSWQMVRFALTLMVLWLKTPFHANRVKRSQ